VKAISQAYGKKGAASSSGLGPLALPPGLQKVLENNYWFFLVQTDSASQLQQQHDNSLADEEDSFEVVTAAVSRPVPSTQLLLCQSVAAVSGKSPASKRRAASTSALPTSALLDRAPVSSTRLFSYRENSSSDSEDEEGDFWQEPRKKLRGRLEEVSSSGAGESPACASQDLHYSCRAATARPVTPTALAQDGPGLADVFTVSRPVDAASDPTMPAAGSKKRFQLGRSKRK
jgi:hypothetical protein